MLPTIREPNTIMTAISSNFSYVYDFKSQFKDFPEAEDLDFESEILFTTKEYVKDDYKFIFSYDDEEIMVEMTHHIAPKR